ncbi:MAG TPA: ATP-dependent DNA helicase RecG [Blastocatellia bacterium]|nr:ATP-dependent DNA helicase RecG [Blastocatellia bacterium]
MLDVKTPVYKLHLYGIPRLGEVRARRLAQALAEINDLPDIRQVTVEHLLLYLPMRYEDRSNLARVADLSEGVAASTEVVVVVAGSYAVKGGQLTIFEISARDATGQIRAFWWNRTWLEKTLGRGTRVILYGIWRFNRFKHCFEAENPDFEVLSEEEAGEPIHTGRRVPVYRKLGPFTTRQLRTIIHHVLAQLPPDGVPEILPHETLARHHLISRYQALRQIHFPSDEEPLQDYNEARSPAHRRLIFEEFLLLQLALGIRRRERETAPKGTVIRVDDRIRQIVRDVLPFRLTPGQKQALRQIIADMCSSRPMNRLLQGDVGSGKTIVAVLAMIVAVENGYQAALMVPTEILAEQHARNIKRLLARTPYRVELLTGSLKNAEKRDLYDAIAAGEVQIVIGTHALIQEGVTFHRLGLVVIDEQHRFGVLQRAELIRRGYNPDVLVMTATPIPRSLAMTVYGDLDVSVIPDLPPGRTPVRTFLRTEDARPAIYHFIATQVRAGRQVYIVYPLVEESEKMDLLNATQMAEHLQKVVFPQFRVGLLHGKMKPAEKDDIMQRFLRGEIHILVATTVIEVGVDVPNATVMLIEHAERFGLAQLHQLRGRVGRGSEKSYCILLARDVSTDEARARLGIMVETTDGFRIAEKDLEIRGPGELMGTKQSGLPVFRIGNLLRDQPLLEAARREARSLLQRRSRPPELDALIYQIRQRPQYGLASVG